MEEFIRNLKIDSILGKVYKENIDHREEFIRIRNNTLWFKLVGLFPNLPKRVDFSPMEYWGILRNIYPCGHAQGRHGEETPTQHSWQTIIFQCYYTWCKWRRSPRVYKTPSFKYGELAEQKGQACFGEPELLPVSIVTRIWEVSWNCIISYWKSLHILTSAETVNCRASMFSWSNITFTL